MLATPDDNSFQFANDRLAALQMAEASLNKPNVTIADLTSAVKALLAVASYDLQDVIDSADAAEED